MCDLLRKILTSTDSKKRMNGLKLCLALAAGVAAFSEYEQGPVYDQWSLYAGDQTGKWRGVWERLATNFLPKDAPATVNFVKFEVQTGNGP